VTGLASCTVRAGPHNLSMADMTTITVSARTRERLKRLADDDRLSLDAELARILDQAERARFWAGARADYERLRADPREWADYLGELAGWEQLAGDGL